MEDFHDFDTDSRWRLKTGALPVFKLPKAWKSSKKRKIVASTDTESSSEIEEDKATKTRSVKVQVTIVTPCTQPFSVEVLCLYVARMNSLL